MQKKIGPISPWIINYPWLHPISCLYYCAKDQLSSSQCYQDTWMASNLWSWFQRIKPDFLIAGHNVHVLRLCRGRSPGDITHSVLPLDGASVGHFHLQTWREVDMNGQLYTLINAHHSRLNWIMAATNHPFTACLSIKRGRNSTEYHTFDLLGELDSLWVWEGPPLLLNAAQL